MGNQRNITMAAYGKSIGGMYPSVLMDNIGVDPIIANHYKLATRHTVIRKKKGKAPQLVPVC